MSLTDWVNRFDVELADALVTATLPDALPVLGATPMKAAPLTSNYAGVGRAFDYAMRMRLVQINRGMLSVKSLAQGGKLVAESSVYGDRKRQRFIKDFWRKWAVAVGQDSVDSLLSDCLVLSNMEAVCRSGRDLGNDVIFSVDSRDVEDLRNLVGLLDTREWRAEVSCVLNPTFGASSRLVGGADADFVIDGTLFDIKVTKYLDMRREYLRQIVGYYTLNLRESDVHSLRAVGIYFARHGVAVSMRCHAAALTWPGLEYRLKEYARSLR